MPQPVREQPKCQCQCRQSPEPDPFSPSPRMTREFLVHETIIIKIVRQNAELLGVGPVRPAGGFVRTTLRAGPGLFGNQGAALRACLGRHDLFDGSDNRPRPLPKVFSQAGAPMFAENHAGLLRSAWEKRHRCLRVHGWMVDRTGISDKFSSELVILRPYL